MSSMRKSTLPPRDRADNQAIKSVYCGGVPVVQNGRHVAREAIVERYRHLQV